MKWYSGPSYLESSLLTEPCHIQALSILCGSGQWIRTIMLTIWPQNTSTSPQHADVFHHQDLPCSSAESYSADTLCLLNYTLVFHLCDLWFQFVMITDIWLDYHLLPSLTFCVIFVNPSSSLCSRRSISPIFRLSRPLSAFPVTNIRTDNMSTIIDSVGKTFSHRTFRSTTATSESFSVQINSIIRAMQEGTSAGSS